MCHEYILLCQYVFFAVVSVCFSTLFVVFHSSYHFGLIYSIYSFCFLSSAQRSHSLTLHHTHTKTTKQHIHECVRESLFYTHTTVKFNDSSRWIHCCCFFFLISDHTWVFCTRSPYNWHNQIWNDRARAYINQFKREGRQKKTTTTTSTQHQ